MGAKEEIIQALAQITEGVNPLTGEIISLQELRQDPAFQEAFRGFLRAYGKAAPKRTYAWYEQEYPQHVVLLWKGDFLAAHNHSALVLNRLLGYRLYIDSYQRKTTGGPDKERITTALREAGFSYILVRRGELEERFDRDNPFAELAEPDTAAETAGASEFPEVLLRALYPELEEYPAGMGERLTEFLESPAAFPDKYHRDGEILLAYYRDGLTLRKVGERFSITGERVRQLLQRELKRLRRKPIRLYLTGEASLPTKAAPGSVPETRDGTLSISALARLLPVPEGGKLRYGEIKDWLIAAGDLRLTEDETLVPTPQGEAHGIRRGKRVNGAGMEYEGVYLEPEGQEYIRGNLEAILS